MKEILKVGDKVKLVRITSEIQNLYKERLNKTGIITNIINHVATVKWDDGCVHPDSPYLINLEPKQFTKSNLKDHHIVVYSNGIKMLWEDCGFQNKVSQNLADGSLIEVWEFDKLVWKREEDKPIEKLLNNSANYNFSKTQNGMTKEDRRLLDSNFRELGNKINEIIDKVNELEMRNE